MKTDATMDSIIEILKRENDFVVFSHEFPDGDGIGSQLAMFHLLDKLGKKVTLVNRDKVPEQLLFMPGSDRLVREHVDVTGSEVVVMIDVPVPERCGFEDGKEYISNARHSINIDHHISCIEYAEHNWIDPDASSVGEMLFQLFDRGGFNICRDAAICLYTSMITDTGNFRYSNTTAETLRVAGELIKLGADPAAISGEIYSNLPHSRYRLLALALDTLTLINNGTIATIKVTREMMEKTGASPNDTDGIVNYTSTIKGVRIGVFLRETDDGKVKASLRSKTSKYNVNLIAGKFGGGGHPTASGCTIQAPLEKAEEMIINEAQQTINTEPKQAAQ
jgi:bifunctional oligoribonuclease and PAP phosphatase NrnA